MSWLTCVACEEEYVSAEKDVMTSRRMLTPLARVISREMGRTSGPLVGECVNVGVSPQFADSMRIQEASAEESRNMTSLGPAISPPESTLRANQNALEPCFSST